MSTSKRQIESRRSRRAGRSTVQGAGALKAVLRMVPDAVAGDVRDAIAESTKQIYDEAESRAPAPGTHPYATGDLKAKLQYKISKDGLRGRIGSWGRRRARHIHLVEFGTHPHQIPMPGGRVIEHPGAAAKPFLFPAYRIHRNAVIQRIRAAVTRALQRVAAGGHPTLAGEAADAALGLVNDREVQSLVGDDG